MIIYDRINFNRTEAEQKIVEEWIKQYNNTLKEYECYFDLRDEGFDVRNLYSMRQFYQCFENRYALCTELSWVP